MKNELIRTLVYVVIALACLGLAWVTYPVPETFEPKEIIGQPVTPEFTHPDQAAEITITRFVTTWRGLEEIRIANVEQKQGRKWTIAAAGQDQPFPANDVERRSEALTPLIGKKVVQVITDSSRSAGDFEQFGVIQPNPTLLKGDGVGKHVTIKSRAGEVLFDLVIGNEVTDRPDVEGKLYYVRRPDEERVLVVQFDDLSKLTTRFQDWVGKPLLDIESGGDVKKIGISDYTFDIPPPAADCPWGVRGLASEAAASSPIKIRSRPGEPEVDRR